MDSRQFSRLAAAATCLITFASPAAAQALPTAGQCDALAAASERGGGVVLIVKVAGKVVCERYAPGYGAEITTPLYSGGKSVVGLVAAALVADGLLDLDEPVARSLPAWRDGTSRAAITVRQLLSLVSGIATPPPALVAPSFAQAMALPAREQPEASFAYGPAAFQIFGGLVEQKLADAGRPESFEAYLKRRITDPAGLAPIGFARARDGRDPNIPGGARMTPAQWLAFGEFVRGEARVGGRPLVDAQAFAQQFAGSAANPAYGIGWWLAGNRGAVGGGREVRDPLAPAGATDMVMAMGATGQRLYISRSLGMTAVRMTAGMLRGFDPAAFSDRAFLADLVTLARAGPAA